MPSKHTKIVFCGIGLIAIGSVVGILSSRKTTNPQITASPDPSNPAALQFVGSQKCVECHKSQYDDWLNSHHDLAMQEANEKTVLGDFNNASLTHFGITSTFFKKDDKFFVNTEGPDGKMQDFQIEYTFGVTPLQQYLIPFPNGRYQCLNVAWNSEKKQWFELHPDERIPPDDELHWTRPLANWNHMCAECHSTDFHKNFDVASNTYNSTWAEINVSCEACHGPGSAHIAWTQNPEKAKIPEDLLKTKGFPVDLSAPPDRIHFSVDAQGKQKVSLKDPNNQAQVETCARCHSRRHVIATPYEHGKAMMDTHLPEHLRENIYHPDGQIQDEVYVHGSFIQSKMHQAGVRCTDCHNPHSLKLHANGNALCARCHQPAEYDTPQHHHHPEGSAGAQCVECHMPSKTYMVVDPRRDHSLRIPRPDLSLKIGTPNACNRCHKDQNAQWAADAILQWRNGQEYKDPHYGEIIAAARNNPTPESQKALQRAIENDNYPAIARATMLNLLSNHPIEKTRSTIESALEDPSPLIRYHALSALEQLPSRPRIELLTPLINDPVKAVRIEAIRTLSSIPPQAITKEQMPIFESSIKAYEEAQMANNDQPNSHFNMGVLYAGMRQYEKAEKAYRTAIHVDNNFIQARVNLANLLHSLKRNAEAEKLFREVIELRPDFGDGHYSLALLLAASDYKQAEKHLRKASELMPNRSRVHYNLSLALQHNGKIKQAESTLLKAYKLEPTNYDYLRRLTEFYLQTNRIDKALSYGQILLQHYPNDQNAIELMGLINYNLEASKTIQPQ